MWKVENDAVRELDYYGYDVLPPAVLSDGSLALGAYSGEGATLTDSEGQIIWSKREFRDADRQPVANSYDEIAFGNANENETLFLDRHGEEIFRVMADFAVSEHPDGWITRGHQDARLYSRDGVLLWQKQVGMGHCQASIDSNGYVYAPTRGGVTVFHPHGEELFKIHQGEKFAWNVALYERGAAFALGNRLLLVE